MRTCMRFTLLVLASAFTFGSTLAQSGDVAVGKIDFPKKVWGTQTMRFDAINNTDLVKFLTLQTIVTFEESYAPARREISRNYILEPHATLVCDPQVEIPGNYGRAVVRIVIHDVIDTLDDVSLGQKVFEQPFFLTFAPPEAVLPYRQDGISLPPLINNSYLVDNEFSRLLLIMLQEGKTPAEIAAITGADSASIVAQINLLSDNQYLTTRNGQYIPAIPVILRAEADEVRGLAGRVSDAIVQRIKENWPNYDSTAKSMLENQSKLGGNQGFMSGIAVLNQPYPVVTGMFLWAKLGARFINGTDRLEIYRQVNPCRPFIAQYSYLVQGGDYYNGHQYFDGQSSTNSETLLFGDTVPVYECLPGAPNKNYRLLPEYNPETFQYDTTYTNPPLRVLDQGIEEIQTGAAAELQDIHMRYDHTAFTAGVKYWFWNLTATLVTDKLVKDGVVTRHAGGQYRYQRRNK